MLSALRIYLDRHGIGAVNFSCRHFDSCRGNESRFTTAKESFVGLDYERGTLPRLLFLSLDSGSAEADSSRKTLEAARREEMAVDVHRLPRGRHWYETHELAWVLLQQFRPGLQLSEISSYFAHVNSAKCCMNKDSRSKADQTLFENCRKFIPGEIELLKPDIIVSQGDEAKQVRNHFRVLQQSVERIDRGKCDLSVIACGPRNALWIATYHPKSWGNYWPQKKACWRLYASAVEKFQRTRTLATHA